MDTKFSASILSANPMQFGNAIKDVEAANIEFIHVDVMDGHFVPNITMGPFIVNGLKEITDVTLDIHLMIENPEKYVKPFANAASENDILTFHIEATKNAKDLISLIKSYGLRAGVALNPATPFEDIEDIINDADLILVMTVVPGFSGQKFMENCLPKLKKISKIVNNKLLEVDGGINVDTASLAVNSGANVLAAASSLFNADSVEQGIQALRNSLQD